ncbi:ferritin-like domain-containing protein [Candidatus Micrarchaeota archaeon]|nr:ferritin-like domain-containing protein [Candidatus Micrarchaeota archaeon]
MAKVTKEIVGENVGKIVEELNKALADEWLAYMQYMLAANIVKVPQVEGELKSIAKDELEHAEELTERIIQLGGKPIADPKQFYEKTNCGYAVPVEDTKKVLHDALKGEGCAIRVYNKVAKLTKESDPVTYQLMLHIMEEEQEHEQKLENLLDWLKE